jgi:hypothetical protein
VACGTPFEPKRPNPHGYLATSLAVTCPRLGASYGLWDTLRTKINKSAFDTLFCASQNASRESLAASCRPASYADWDVAVAAQGLVHHMACGAPFEPKGTNPHGYLATRVAVTPYFALRKMFPGRVWYPLVGQLGMRIGTSPLLRKAWACGTPFEPKRTNPHGYLAARLAAKLYFALRKMLPGRVWQPLVGQLRMRIGT